MRQSRGPLLAAGAVALAMMVSGCGGGRVERLRVEPANPFTGTVKPLEGGVNKVALGETAAVGPYMVTLTAEGEPKEGQNRFTARVANNPDVKPVPGEKPGVTLPGGRMDTPGSTETPDPAVVATSGAPFMVELSLTRSDWQGEAPTVSLKPEAPGVFSGALEIPKPGGWLAQVTVVGAQGPESAFFTLSTDGKLADIEPLETATSVQSGAERPMPRPGAIGTYGNAQFGSDQ